MDNGKSKEKRSNFPLSFNGNSRRAKYSFIQASSLVAHLLSFKANAAVKVGGVLFHSRWSHQAGTEPPGFTTEALLKLSLLPHRFSLLLSSAATEQIPLDIGLGNRLYPVTSWQAYQTARLNSFSGLRVQFCPQLQDLHPHNRGQKANPQAL